MMPKKTRLSWNQTLDSNPLEKIGDDHFSNFLLNQQFGLCALAMFNHGVRMLQYWFSAVALILQLCVHFAAWTACSGQSPPRCWASTPSDKNPYQLPVRNRGHLYLVSRTFFSHPKKLQGPLNLNISLKVKLNEKNLTQNHFFTKEVGGSLG